ncbi:hypothetical protein KM043_009147 [Ampulex compressa]|nr:hypothetical protein KM043_009147 [Ampulex compressa]
MSESRSGALRSLLLRDHGPLSRGRGCVQVRRSSGERGSVWSPERTGETSAGRVSGLGHFTTAVSSVRKLPRLLTFSPSTYAARSAQSPGFLKQVGALLLLVCNNSATLAGQERLDLGPGRDFSRPSPGFSDVLGSS